jgi:polar amino acid transport system substrate-binding protein
VTGESPEIIRAVLGKIGVKKIDSVLTEWGGLIPGLQAGRFDLIAAGMYITPERRQQVLFTDPHYQVRDTLLVARIPSNSPAMRPLQSSPMPHWR